VPSVLGAPSAIRPWLSQGATTTLLLLRIRLIFALSGAVKTNNSSPSTTNHNAVATVRPSRRNVLRADVLALADSTTVMPPDWTVCGAEVAAVESLYS
jgi:hypothetical protein